VLLFTSIVLLLFNQGSHENKVNNLAQDRARDKEWVAEMYREKSRVLDERLNNGERVPLPMGGYTLELHKEGNTVMYKITEGDRS